MRVLGVSVLRGYCPSQTTTSPALVGLLTSEPGSPGLLVASWAFGNPARSSRDNGQKDWAILHSSVTAAGPFRNSTGFPVCRPFR